MHSLHPHRSFRATTRPSQLLLAIASIGLLLASSIHAATWKVDSSLGREADFRTLQDAVDSVQVNPGDTLHVAPGANYGDVTLTKSLNIIGPGYFLAQNYGSLSSMPHAAMGVMAIAANNCLITGLYIDLIRFNGDHSNIVIQRNRIESYQDGTSSTGVRVIQNYIEEGVDFDQANATETLSDYVFSNNYIGRSSFGPEAVIWGRDDAVLMEFNVITGSIYISMGLQALGGIIRNNIIMDESTNASIYGIGALVSYNFTASGVTIGSGHTAPGSTGNVTNLGDIAIDALFDFSTPSPDGRFKLAGDSAAKDAAHDGSDCGMFGGPASYILSVLPSVPIVTQLDMPASVSQGSGLPVTVTLEINP